MCPSSSRRILEGCRRKKARNDIITILEKRKQRKDNIGEYALLLDLCTQCFAHECAPRLGSARQHRISPAHVCEHEQKVIIHIQ